MEKVNQSENQKGKKSKNKSSFLWLLSVCFITVGLLLFCQFYFGDSVSDKTTFYENTYVNGIDVSGMTKAEAKNLLSTSLTQNKDNIEITLKHEDKTWTLNGDDFELIGNIDNSLDEIIKYGREGNIFEKKKIENKIKSEGLQVNIPYQNLFGGIDNKLNLIISEIEKEPVSSTIVFNPDAKNMFSLSEGQNGYVVNRDLLEQEINEAIIKGKCEIEIPLQDILPNESLENMLEQISLRSHFSTDYSKSTENRKNNIKKALTSFNGLIVEPNEEISFNSQTGPRTKENGYKNANIIFGGSYVSGVAGGVCQASTTLYNALLLADVEIIKANHHSLPASYVPLSFDAMVSEGYADLVFKNNLDTPIYIKTYCDSTNANVEIYGQPFEEGISIKTRSELVKILPHNGDNIISDKNGEYSNKVLYKGEYFRLKYPQEGYESKGYIQYYKNGELIEEKLIRHDHYQPQNGILIEGTFDLEDGMTLPQSNVKYISPQKVTSQTIENAKKKWHID